MFYLTSNFKMNNMKIYWSEIYVLNCKAQKIVIMSPPVGLGGILFLPWSSVRLSVRLSVTKSCPLYN